MGAWGHGIFENDDALDWVYDLVDVSDHSVIAKSLGHILDSSEDYLESPDCCEALAAAETVAALLDKPVSDLPEEIKKWVQDKPTPTQTLIANTQAAIKAILNKSELKELWEDVKDLDTWEATVHDLQNRLK